jgi:hypothetical protein
VEAAARTSGGKPFVKNSLQKTKHKGLFSAALLVTASLVPLMLPLLDAIKPDAITARSNPIEDLKMHAATITGAIASTAQNCPG